MIWWTLLGAFVFFCLFVRFAPNSAKSWHVDPLTAKLGRKPNQYLSVPNGDVPPPVFQVRAQTLAQVFDGVAMAQPRVTRLAGSVEQGWVTYVQRSQLFGYPDFLSVKFIPIDDNASTLAIYARSRFGRSDFGVNHRRVKAWIGAVGKALL